MLLTVETDYEADCGADRRPLPVHGPRSDARRTEGDIATGLGSGFVGQSLSSILTFCRHAEEPRLCRRVDRRAKQGPFHSELDICCQLMSTAFNESGLLQTEASEDATRILHMHNAHIERLTFTPEFLLRSGETSWPLTNSSSTGRLFWADLDDAWLRCETYRLRIEAMACLEVLLHAVHEGPCKAACPRPT
ncbi:unnamed protein product [Protopolystoma xenopodis]|uniref:Uncharacterized protein n=1 Tax=Protopolystoma xenopodis TaxID=117903 RepID=A0A3S5AXC1_9PLAT|nr:unnamed protein product [Protopolystoma xenopodis]